MIDPTKIVGLKLTDGIYGERKIEDPLVTEIITSRDFLRLRDIQQYGLLPEVCPSFSRFAHSLGVYFLLRDNGASREEQIAGLVHDVSHTAFSHTYDALFEGDLQRQDGQDRVHEAYLKRSAIGKMIMASGLDLDRVANPELFARLERDIPDLCADRIDYGLREINSLAGNEGLAKGIATHLAANDTGFYFTQGQAAITFAREFLRSQQEFCGPQRTFETVALAGLFRLCLEKGVIKKTDFKEDDTYILDKIKRAEDEDVKQAYNYLLRSPTFGQSTNSADPLYHMKHRFVDPLIQQGEIFVRASEVDSTLADLIEERRVEREAGYRLDTSSIPPVLLEKMVA
jgi:uncharacterized protein